MNILNIITENTHSPVADILGIPQIQLCANAEHFTHRPFAFLGDREAQIGFRSANEHALTDAVSVVRSVSSKVADIGDTVYIQQPRDSILRGEPTHLTLTDAPAIGHPCLQIVYLRFAAAALLKNDGTCSVVLAFPQCKKSIFLPRSP